MMTDLKIIFATELGRVLLALAFVAPFAIYLAWDLFRQLRADLKHAHTTVNRLLADKAKHLREVGRG